MATGLLRNEAYTPANEERAGSLRRVHFMRRQRKQITAQAFDVNRQAPARLYCISVKPEVALAALALFAYELADFGYRLNGPDFVVGQHDADQNRLGSQRSSHVVDADDAITVNGQARHLPVLLFQLINHFAN